MPAEVGHEGAPLIKGIPEAARPILANFVCVPGRPFPGEHALAGPADRLEQQHRMRVGRRGPVVQDLKLGLATQELVRADIRRLGIKRRRGGDGVWFGFFSVGRGAGSLECMPDDSACSSRDSDRGSRQHESPVGRTLLGFGIQHRYDLPWHAVDSRAIAPKVMVRIGLY